MRVSMSGSPSLVLLAVSAAVTLTSCSSIHLNPSKPTPVITWPRPAPITNPAPLTSAQLDATANVPGTFVYSPPAGTVLAAGTQTLTTTFTPADTAVLTSAASSLTIVVNNPATGNPPTIAAQHMVVADEGNNRVLIYDAPIGNGASVVLGQPNFTDSANSGNASYPNTVSASAIAMDAEGNLFVADTPHCRVLEFQPPFTTGMNASAAIGWPSLTYSNPSGPSCIYVAESEPINRLESPWAVAVDSQGNLWVADTQYAEVFEYVPPFSTGMAPSVVLGTLPCQVGRTTFTPPTAMIFCEPEGLAFDPQGNLWVADWGYIRILEFKPPFSTGMAASLEIGQSAANPFAEATPCDSSGPSASCLRPATIAFDAAGDLWATDPWENRVLEFAPPYTNGMAASLVLGQPDFTSGALQATAANTFYFSSNNGVSVLQYDGGLWFDSSGDLLVGDGGNERILVFTPPFSSDMNASMVIGQPNMTSGTPCEDQNENTATPATNTLCAPMGILTY